MEYSVLKTIYFNPLSKQEDVVEFVLEGEARVSFENESMRLQNLLDDGLGQKANFAFWCPEDFPENIEICWEFKPVREPGLCIMFFSAKGKSGESIFSENMVKRNGEYDKYHSGDINCYHISYFRRKWESERRFHTCNLRKSAGFYLTAQGADPLPGIEDSKGFYSIRIVKLEGHISFFIEGLMIFEWFDNGSEYGAVLNGGKIGFRQMAPLIGEYRNLKINEIGK